MFPYKKFNGHQVQVRVQDRTPLGETADTAQCV